MDGGMAPGYNQYGVQSYTQEFECLACGDVFEVVLREELGYVESDDTEIVCPYCGCSERTDDDEV